MTCHTTCELTPGAKDEKKGVTAKKCEECEDGTKHGSPCNSASKCQCKATGTTTAPAATTTTAPAATTTAYTGDYAKLDKNKAGCSASTRITEADECKAAGVAVGKPPRPTLTPTRTLTKRPTPTLTPTPTQP